MQYEKLENDRCVCLVCGKEYSKYGINNHIQMAHNNRKNPSEGKPSWNRGLTKETDDRVRLNSISIGNSKRGQKLKPLTEAHKRIISAGMRKAHSEGRAWNIGRSRWNNEPSYPEKFFMKVIENEFDDKNYRREFPFHKFSLDFAWIEKKKVIEIDGQQHQRFEDQIRRDKEKDQLLKKEGWEVLRIKWSDMFNDTKHWIQIAKEFMSA